MGDMMTETFESNGSLVAFEGPRDIISTQIHLLPHSPHILVLPPLESFVNEIEPGSPFNAQLHILRTHDACRARTEVARDFLRGSTPSDKRLVFLNGGTASAQLSCIDAISQHETDGDITRAEARFNDLIQHGVTGLKRQHPRAQDIHTPSKAGELTDTEGRKDDILGDPISQAMRAAEALDLETASLQETHELDLGVTVRPRSISVPNLPIGDDGQDAASVYLFRPTESVPEVPAPGSPRQGHDLYVEKWRAVTRDEDQLTDPNLTPRTLSYASDAHQYDRLRPTSAVGPSRAPVESLPCSPALLGEAFVVDMRPFNLRNYNYADLAARMHGISEQSDNVSLHNSLRVTKLEEPLWIEERIQGTKRDSAKESFVHSSSNSETSRQAPFQPEKATMRRFVPSPLTIGPRRPKQPTSPGHESTSLSGHRGDQDVVDTSDLNAVRTELRKSDSFVLSPGSSFELHTNEPFQTVLPMTEDLIIHFRIDEDKSQLEGMIEAFKHGTYPVSMPPLLSETGGDMEQPETPSTRGSTRKPDDKEDQQAARESVPIYSPDEYDPYSVYGNGLWPTTTAYLSKEEISNQPQDAAIISSLPPLHQGPFTINDTLSDKVFHDFDLRQFKTALCIQTSLRSILNTYFPWDHLGHHRFDFSPLSELRGFWRPVFQEISTEDHTEIRSIDLILAMGAQNSADRGLLGAIGGALEKLGKEPNGASRSGKLDLRYLIANSMQAFASRYSSSRTRENPLTNPLLLATLIIPHLEMYIAAHSATRFLILEYPAEYLSIVLALQNLMGVGILKVVGIVDAEAGSPKPYPPYGNQSLRTVTHSATSSVSTTGTGATRHSQKKSNSEPKIPEGAITSQPSFSKANLILTSKATESEIATLISTIWKILISISASYVPENVAGSAGRRSGNRPPSPSCLVHPTKQYSPLLTAAEMLGFVPPPSDGQQQQSLPRRGAQRDYVSSGTYADIPVSTLMQRAVTPASSAKLSISETYRNNPTARTPRTPKIPRSTYNQRNKARHMLGRDPNDFSQDRDVEVTDGEWYYEPEEEDDHSQFTADERKYMPLWSNQSGPRKGNSRKALKWLGLS